jgi:hypothetical protein
MARKHLGQPPVKQGTVPSLLRFIMTLTRKRICEGILNRVQDGELKHLSPFVPQPERCCQEAIKMDRLSERQRVPVHPADCGISAGNPQGWGAGVSSFAYFPWTSKESKVVWATAHVMWVLRWNTETI